MSAINAGNFHANLSTFMGTIGASPVPVSFEYFGDDILTRHAAGIGHTQAALAPIIETCHNNPNSGMANFFQLKVLARAKAPDEYATGMSASDPRPLEDFAAGRIADRLPLTTFVDQAYAIHEALRENDGIMSEAAQNAADARAQAAEFQTRGTKDYFEQGVNQFLAGAMYARYGRENNRAGYRQKASEAFMNSALTFSNMRAYAAAAMAYEMALIETQSVRPSLGRTRAEDQLAHREFDRATNEAIAYSWLQTLRSDKDPETYKLRLERAKIFAFRTANAELKESLLDRSATQNLREGNPEASAADILRRVWLRLHTGGSQGEDAGKKWKYVKNTIQRTLGLWRVHDLHGEHGATLEAFMSVSETLEMHASRPR